MNTEKLIDEIQVGTKDYDRELRLNDIEEKLKDLAKLRPAEIVSLCKKSVIFCGIFCKITDSRL